MASITPCVEDATTSVLHDEAMLKEGEIRVGRWSQLGVGDDMDSIFAKYTQRKA